MNVSVSLFSILFRFAGQKGSAQLLPIQRIQRKRQQSDLWAKLMNLRFEIHHFISCLYENFVSSHFQTFQKTCQVFDDLLWQENVGPTTRAPFGGNFCGVRPSTKVTDLHRVMEVAKSLWLLLEHSNEVGDAPTIGYHRTIAMAYMA